MWFQILHNLISNGNIARSSLYFLSIRMIHGSPAPYLLDIIMRRMAEGIERASFANEVSEALPVNSGLSFRRAFSIVPASTRRLACARKYHDWWARNSSPISSILTLLSSSLSLPLSIYPCCFSSFTSHFDLFGTKFTRNTQWNLILRAHTFVFGHLTHHLPRPLFDHSTPSYGCLSRRISFLFWMRDAWNLKKKSIKRDYIGWRTRSLSRDSWTRDILSSSRNS